MPDANDMDLVRDYARQNSESAFAELVRRHINLVYSVAMRFTGNAGDADDVTQAVFILLARKAAGLSDRTVLTGWLYETTRLTAAGVQRTRRRRRFWEQEACMQSNLNAPDSGQLWRQLAPHLEAAMSRLAERDRTLLALRFYENKTGAEAAALMGIGAEAAHKRTARALEKLRSFFAKRGVDSTAAAIGENISANSIQIAPVALAKSVTAVAIVKGSIASASTLTLIKGAMKIMAWTKAKAAVVAATVLILAAGTTKLAVNKMSARNRIVTLQTLTLKVNPGMFITNILAQGGETMNTSSNHWSDILLDMMRIQGVDCSPPRGIALNTLTGEITTQNTLDALEKFRRTVEELNQPDGKCRFFQRVPSQEEILFTANCYKLNRSDFDRLGLGKPTARATRSGSA